MPDTEPFDPWWTLNQEWPGVAVHYRVMPHRWGQTTWDNGNTRIDLAHDLDRTQQRVTLTHEIGHLRVGAPCISLCGNNETEVIEWTARILIPDLEELAELLRRHDLHTVAARLDVTDDVVNDRMVTLTKVERAELAKAIGDSVDTGDVLAAHGAPRRNPRPAHMCKVRREAGHPATPARNDTDTRPPLVLPAGSAN
jgi:hypothetical protein